MDLKLSSWKPKESFYSHNYKIGETFTTKYSKLLKEKLILIKKGIKNERNSEN
jgi:hypothetical protein